MRVDVCVCLWLCVCVCLCLCKLRKYPTSLYHFIFSEHTATTGAPAVHGHGDKFASQKLPVISAKWVRDDGIIRLLKSFTSWQKLQGKKTREFNETTLLTGKDSLHFKVTRLYSYICVCIYLWLFVSACGCLCLPVVVCVCLFPCVCLWLFNCVCLCLSVSTCGVCVCPSLPVVVCVCLSLPVVVCVCPSLPVVV